MYSICKGGFKMTAELEKNIIFAVLFIAGMLLVLAQM